MPGAVALLRGINVGGHRRLPMGKLRALAEELGFENPQTYVASGNLVFKSDQQPDAIAAALELAIERRFGFPVDVVVRARPQWQALLRSNPFADEAAAEPKWVWLFLSKQPPKDGAADDLAKASPGLRTHQSSDALWIHMPEGATMKILSIPWDRLIGSPSTSRNWRTVETIGQMLDQIG